MTTTAIELANQRKVELSYLQMIGQVLAESHYFNDAHTAQQAVAKILAGQEFGMGVMEAMRSFHVIDGKVEMSADAQARLVKASDLYDYRVITLTEGECEIGFFQDGAHIGTSRFTFGDAERAGIVKSESAWQKYPRNMLFARALTNGVAWFCPDAISGGRVYAPGEVSGEVWEQPLELEPTGEVKASPSADTPGGMGESGGTDAEAAGEQSEAAVPESGRAAVSDPAALSSAGSLAYGEGADGPGVDGEAGDSTAAATSRSTPNVEEPRETFGKAPHGTEEGGPDLTAPAGIAEAPSSDTLEEQKKAYYEAFRAGPGLPNAFMMAKKLYATEARPLKTWKDFYALSVEELFGVALAFEEAKSVVAGT